MNQHSKTEAQRTSAGLSAAGSTTQRAKLRPEWLLIIATLLWSGNFIAGRLLRDDITPVALSFWRWVLALAVLLPLSAAHIRHHWRLILGEWKLIIALGVTGITTYTVLIYKALAVSPVINTALVMATLPLLIVLASWFMYHERISRAQALGLVVSLLGAVVVVTRGDLMTLRFHTGDLWMVAAMPQWALYTVLQKRQPAGLPSLSLLTASVIAGVLLLAPFYLWQLTQATPMRLTLASSLGLGYIALGSSVVGYLLWNRGVAVLGPNRSGPFLHLLPLFSALLAIALLGEAVAGYHVIGAALVISGLALGSRRQSHQ